MNYIGISKTVHADFGSGLYEGSLIGIPYLVVAGTQPKLPLYVAAYPDESDPGPMPIPLRAPIEGAPNPGDGDRHVLVLDKDHCWLYELYRAAPRTNFWAADSSAVWDMTVNGQRPYTWTSADAGGLAVFAGLARYDEVATGEIRHALRFTVSTTQKAFTPPATHWASSTTDPDAPPMGMRIRLKSTFDVSPYPSDVQVILNALKKYGAILADNGSAIFLSGAPDPRWNNDHLQQLGNVHGSDFEVVRMNAIYTPDNVPQGAPPTITSFNASATNVPAGTPVTLTWDIQNGGYLIVSPQVGTVRGSSVVVVPQQTTTYRLYATNAYGRRTAAVTVTVTGLAHNALGQ